MILYTKRYVNIVSFIITIIIFIFFYKLNITFNQFDFNPQFISKIINKNVVKVELNSNNINQGTEDKKIKIQNNLPDSQNYQAKENWKIIIPVISLEAEISESTSKEVMNKYVGHFEETSKTNGNIGLAAHNRGYEVNYFKNIKNLKKGDEIIYKYYEYEKKYEVIENKIIKDTDWSYLKETEENKITLITCVENEPDYRRCVQGIEK